MDCMGSITNESQQNRDLYLHELMDTKIVYWKLIIGCDAGL